MSQDRSEIIVGVQVSDIHADFLSHEAAPKTEPKVSEGSVCGGAEEGSEMKRMEKQNVG